MIMHLDAMEMATFVGALTTAKYYLTESLSQYSLDQQTDYLIGIDNIERLLEKAEGILKDELGI